WKRRVAIHLEITASTASTTASPKAKMGLSTTNPVIWASTIAITGITTTAEICWALRGSLTREDIATVAATAIRASNGTHNSIIISHDGLMITANTCGERAMNHIPTM